jgi:diguanylate cyclase (GGDEF)-like protein
MKAELHDLLTRLESAGPERPLRLAIAPDPVAPRREPSPAVAPLPVPDADRPANERADFISRLRRSLADDDSPALLLIDVDGFRAVNHTLGWEAGDRLLDETARRISGVLRQDDAVARFGGDEFAVLLGPVETAAAEQVAARILDALMEPIELMGIEVCPSACIGVVVRTAAHGRAEDLLRDAERALARARVLGRARIEVFDASLARALTLWQLEAALRRALDNEEFRAHFEPTVSMKAGQVAGFEVLLWRKSSRPAARSTTGT